MHLFGRKKEQQAGCLRESLPMGSDPAPRSTPAALVANIWRGTFPCCGAGTDTTNSPTQDIHSRSAHVWVTCVGTAAPASQADGRTRPQHGKSVAEENGLLHSNNTANSKSTSGSPPTQKVRGCALAHWLQTVINAAVQMNEAPGGVLPPHLPDLSDATDID